MIKAILPIQRLWLRLTDERGAGLAEYALLLFVIAVAVATTVATFGDDIGDMFTDAGNQLPVSTPPTT